MKITLTLLVCLFLPTAAQAQFQSTISATSTSVIDSTQVNNALGSLPKAQFDQDMAVMAKFNIANAFPPGCFVFDVWLEYGDDQNLPVVRWERTNKTSVFSFDTWENVHDGLSLYFLGSDTNSSLDVFLNAAKRQDYVNDIAGIRLGALTETAIMVKGIGSNASGNMEYVQLGYQAWTAGDANKDGLFNTSDITFLFEAGRYWDGTGTPLIATWEEGDFDYDGDFDNDDLILAFQMSPWGG